MPHLTLVPRPVRGAPSPEHPEPLRDSGDPVAYVPVKLLLAASGRCSCDDCALEALRQRHQHLRPARRPVRNLHLLR